MQINFYKIETPTKIKSVSKSTFYYWVKNYCGTKWSYTHHGFKYHYFKII